MKKRYAFKGHEVIESIVDAKLGGAGYERVEDVCDAEIVVTYFTNLSALENAYFDEGGIIEQAAPGALVIEMSAETPMFARELFAIADASKLLFAEAPLMVIDACVDNAFADKGNLACFLSAEKDATKAALPILQELVGSIHETTGFGSASMSRAAYTIQSTAALAAATEADALYRAVRCMPAGMGEAAMGNAGAISPMADGLLRAVDEGRFSGTYTIEMMMGELAAALTTAEEADVTLPQAECCLQLLEILAIIGGADNGPAVMTMAFRNQDEVEAIGLDWARAAEVSETAVKTHEHDDDDDYDEYDEELSDDLMADIMARMFDDEAEADYDDDDDYEDDYDDEGDHGDDSYDYTEDYEDDDFGEEAAASAPVRRFVRKEEPLPEEEPVVVKPVRKPVRDEEDYGFEDDDPGYDDRDRDYVELADQEDYDFDE